VIAVTPGDLDILARTIYGEARGEPFEGQKAVAHVIINRLVKTVGDRDHSLDATALRWRQFSAWNESDANRREIERVGLDSRTFRQCLRAALEALDEPDPTGGATHYHASWARPDWATGKAPVVTIYGHRFYTDID